MSVNTMVDTFAKALNQCLINKGNGEKRTQILRRSVVDISAMASDETEKVNEKARKSYPEAIANWLMLLPPFESGTLKCSETRYITWDMQKLDLDEKTFCIKLHEYYYQNGIWFIGHAGETQIVIEGGIKGRECLVSGKATANCFNREAEELTLEDILSYLPGIAEDSVKELYKNRMRFISAVYSDEAVLKKRMDDTYKTALQAFRTLNLLMYINKNRFATKKQAKGISEGLLPTSDSRTVRVLNGITILSDKKPCVHTMQTVRNYRCATWKVRAHQRVCKSGKITYVRSHENRRKGMEKTKAKAQTIRVR